MGELMRVVCNCARCRSPPVKEIQLYPEEEDDDEENEVEPVITSTTGPTSNNTAHHDDSPTTPTTLPPSEPLINSQPPPSMNDDSDPISAERHRRKETLKSTLSALRTMYAGDEQEWKEVLREVGGGSGL
jgi:hypothetical protein